LLFILCAEQRTLYERHVNGKYALRRKRRQLLLFAHPEQEGLASSSAAFDDQRRRCTKTGHELEVPFGWYEQLQDLFWPEILGSDDESLRVVHGWLPLENRSRTASM